MTHLVYVDTETTGLDAAIHEAYEFAWWNIDRDPEPRELHVPHTLRNADPAALDIGKYFERGFFPNRGPNGRALYSELWLEALDSLRGATLVGANPAFDQEFMQRRIFGVKVWHYRIINVEDIAATIFKWDRPKGLTAIVDHLRSLDFDVEAQDHTARGDVRTTREVHEILLELR